MALFPGGYHDYESIRPSFVTEPLFFPNYLQHVDLFVYFSHKLVSCPPPTWTNVLHRNGVKTLGTFIIEPGTLDIERILDDDGGVNRVARQLASIADHLGFDGWLLNIEDHLPLFTSDFCGKILHFINDLKTMLGSEKELIWYDALTQNNEVDYQNGLTSKNCKFANAAGALFTNYAWQESQLAQAGALAQCCSLQRSNIFFGIDMWAQNTDMPGPKRVTFPSEGGGGTMTGYVSDHLYERINMLTYEKATHRLAEDGFSAAVLAPAWAFEHFPAATSQQVDKAVWEGTKLDLDLGCNCRHGKPHQIDKYRAHPLAHCAKQSPAGTEHFFESDFRIPFESVQTATKAHIVRPRIGSMQPQVCFGESSVWLDVAKALRSFRLDRKFVSCYAEPGASRTSHLRISMSPEETRTGAENAQSYTRSDVEHIRLPLFNIGLSLDRPLESRVLYRRNRWPVPDTGVYFRYGSDGKDDIYRDVVLPETDEMSSVHIMLNAPHLQDQYAHVIEFGIYCTQPANEALQYDGERIIDLYHLNIREQALYTQHSAVSHVSVVKHGKGDLVMDFLSWKWESSRDDWPASMPWSALTGPFERFEVYIGDEFLGEVSGIEFPLTTDACKQLDGNTLGEVIIKGKIFGEADGLELWRGNVSLP